MIEVTQLTDGPLFIQTKNNIHRSIYHAKFSNYARFHKTYRQMYRGQSLCETSSKWSIISHRMCERIFIESRNQAFHRRLPSIVTMMWSPIIHQGPQWTAVSLIDKSACSLSSLTGEYLFSVKQFSRITTERKFRKDGPAQWQAAPQQRANCRGTSDV